MVTWYTFVTHNGHVIHICDTQWSCDTHLWCAMVMWHFANQFSNSDAWQSRDLLSRHVMVTWCFIDRISNSAFFSCQGAYIIPVFSHASSQFSRPYSHLIKAHIVSPSALKSNLFSCQGAYSTLITLGVSFKFDQPYSHLIKAHMVFLSALRSSSFFFCQGAYGTSVFPHASSQSSWPSHFPQYY